jgi:type II secretory pathway pseudopilin PulG
MKRRLPTRIGRVAFTLLEMMLSVGIGVMVLAVLIESLVSIQKSLNATDELSLRTNNGARLADAVARDLRRAVGVGTVNGTGTYTAINQSTAAVTTGTGLSDQNTVAMVTASSGLAIVIPDFYASNTPDNSLGSTYKTSRYDRLTVLNVSSTYNPYATSSANAALNGVVPWTQAISSQQVAYNSTGTGLIQVRYTEGPRSSTDSTPCFFRTEYPQGSNTPNSASVEIAEQVIESDSATTLILIDPDRGSPTLVINGKSVKVTDNGTHYRIQTSFTSRYRFTTNTYGIDQYVDVYLRNPRRSNL